MDHSNFLENVCIKASTEKTKLSFYVIISYTQLNVHVEHLLAVILSKVINSNELTVIPMGGAFSAPPCRFFRRASRPIGISRSNFMTFFSQVSRIF